MVILGDQAGVYATWNGSQTTGPGARMMAVNAANGSLLWVTQVETFPTAIITSSPVVYNGIVYVGVASAEEGIASVKGYPCCTFRGSLVALNAQTGAKLWQTYTIPDNHGVAGSYSGGAIWGTTPAIDAARNSVYIGTGNNYSIPAAATACIKANPNNRQLHRKQRLFRLYLGIGFEHWARSSGPAGHRFTMTGTKTASTISQGSAIAPRLKAATTISAAPDPTCSRSPAAPTYWASVRKAGFTTH